MDRPRHTMQVSQWNQSPNDIEIKYTVNGQEQKQEFPKGSAGGFDVTVQSTATPSAIEFKAFQKGTSTVVPEWREQPEGHPN